MASPTGLYYAYATQFESAEFGRYLMIFQDRATADEWWRAVMESVNAGYTRFSEVKRVNPQFYTYTGTEYIINTLTDDRVAKRFLGRALFTLIPASVPQGSTPPVAPVLNYTDHISGRRYYVRSVVEPHHYWALVGGQIITTEARPRTANFVIAIQSSESQTQDGLVMIGSDKIEISTHSTRPKLYVSVGPNSEELTTTPLPGSMGGGFVFSDFINSFCEADSSTNYLIYDPGNGDRWELVAP